jgi:hypothetical protein
MNRKPPVLPLDPSPSYRLMKEAIARAQALAKTNQKPPKQSNRLE